MQGEPSILCMHGVRTIWETNYKAIVQQFYVWHMNKYGFTCLATTGLTCSPFLRTTTVYSTLLTHYRYISKILLAVPFQNSKRLFDSPYNDLITTIPSQNSNSSLSPPITAECCDRTFNSIFDPPCNYLLPYYSRVMCCAVRASLINCCVINCNVVVNNLYVLEKNLQTYDDTHG